MQETATLRGGRPGQPVLALGLLMAAWLGLRGAWIGAEIDSQPVGTTVAAGRQPAKAPAPRALPGQRAESPGDDAWSQAGGQPGLASGDAPLPGMRRAALAEATAVPGPDGAAPAGALEERLPTGLDGADTDAGSESSGATAAKAVGVVFGAAEEAPGHPAERRETVRASGAGRWSADGWFVLRRDARDGVRPQRPGFGAGAYGGSQWGVVARYSLVPGSPLKPQVYGRLSGAAHAPARDREAALGLAVRPLPRVPVQVLAEARVRQGAGPARVAPALALVGGMTRRLPLGAELDGYAQAGWVGGRDATAFFDLQAVVDRRLAAMPDGAVVRGAELRVGAGAWSGGQRDAARLDIGPRVTVRASLAGVGARVALDWRFRIAGQAQPGSGPALTVAAGF